MGDELVMDRDPVGLGGLPQATMNTSAATATQLKKRDRSAWVI